MEVETEQTEEELVAFLEELNKSMRDSVTKALTEFSEKHESEASLIFSAAVTNLLGMAIDMFEAHGVDGVVAVKGLIDEWKTRADNSQEAQPQVSAE